MISARLISRVIDLVAMLVLAHTLIPADFGLVAVAMSLILIVEAACELPVGQALMCLPRIEPQHYDTAFSIAVLRGLVLFGLIATAAVPFAALYGDGRLAALVGVLSLAPIARGLQNPRMIQFARALDFRREFLVEIGGKLAALTLGVGCALMTRSYWSIAVATVAGPLTTAALSYGMAPFRPRLTLVEWPAFQSFLGWTSASQIVTAVTWQSDRLLLGKIMPARQLGLFSAANDMANIPALALFGPLIRPLMSGFVAVAGPGPRLSASYQRAASGIVTVGLPLLLGESLVADPLVRLMLGPQWIEAAPLLSWLSLSLIPSLFEAPLGPLVMALNRPDRLLARNLFELCFKLPLVIAGALCFGFGGVIAARIVSELATVGYGLIVVRQLIGVPATRQLLNSSRAVASAAVMATIVLIARPWLEFSGSTGALLGALTVVVILAATTYCGVLAVLWHLAGEPRGLEAVVFQALSRLWPGGIHRREPPWGHAECDELQR